MTFTDAAAEVLRLVGRPLHYKEITDIAIEKNLLSHVGKSPEVTMGARLAAMLKKDSPENPLIRVKPGVFALRDWDEKTIKAGLDGKKQRRGKVDEERPREDDEAEEPVALDAGPEEPVEAPAEADEAAPEEPLAFEEEDDLAEPEEDAPAEPELSGPTIAQQWGLRADQPAYAPSPTPAARPSRPIHEDEEDEAAGEPAGPDDIMRAEAAAGAAEMFDE